MLDRPEALAGITTTRLDSCGIGDRGAATLAESPIFHGCELQL